MSSCDHSFFPFYCCFFLQRCIQPVTLYKQTRFWNMPFVGAKWFFMKKGEGSTSSLEAGGFICTRKGLSHPDMQLHFLPFAVLDHGRQYPDGHAYQVQFIFRIVVCIFQTIHVL